MLLNRSKKRKIKESAEENELYIISSLYIDIIISYNIWI